jgi:hypothetical protein
MAYALKADPDFDVNAKIVGLNQALTNSGANPQDLVACASKNTPVAYKVVFYRTIRDKGGSATKDDLRKAAAELLGRMFSHHSFNKMFNEFVGEPGIVVIK